MTKLSLLITSFVLGGIACGLLGYSRLEGSLGMLGFVLLILTMIGTMERWVYLEKKDNLEDLECWLDIKPVSRTLANRFRHERV